MREAEADRSRPSQKCPKGLVRHAAHLPLHLRHSSQISWGSRSSQCQYVVSSWSRNRSYLWKVTFSEDAAEGRSEPEVHLNMTNTSSGPTWEEEFCQCSPGEIVRRLKIFQTSKSHDTIYAYLALAKDVVPIAFLNTEPHLPQRLVQADSKAFNSSMIKSSSTKPFVVATTNHTPKCVASSSRLPLVSKQTPGEARFVTFSPHRQHQAR
jgi:hypothetical protein